jgi:hypothetical protein
MLKRQKDCFVWFLLIQFLQKVCKDTGGKALVLRMIAEGYDFSDAEAMYGKGWLDA